MISEWPAGALFTRADDVNRIIVDASGVYHVLVVSLRCRSASTSNSFPHIRDPFE